MRYWPLTVPNFLLGGGFLYPRSPSLAINRIPRDRGALCGAVSKQGFNWAVCAQSTGVRVYEYKFSCASCPIEFSCASCPFVFGCNHLVRIYEQGVGPYSVVLALYTTLSSLGIPHRAVGCRPVKSQLRPRFVGVDGGMEEFLERACSPIFIGCIGKLPPFGWSISPPSVSGSTSCTSPSTASQFK